jgi:hypothetical protein
MLVGILDAVAYGMPEESALFDFFTKRSIRVFETLFPGGGPFLSLHLHRFLQASRRRIQVPLKIPRAALPMPRKSLNWNDEPRYLMRTIGSYTGN